MNPIQSITFNYLRFPLIIGVVFIHAYNLEVNIAGSEILQGSNSEHFFEWETLRYLISQIIARISVPFFFFMSGFLFFLNVEKFDLSIYKSKIKSRVQTLLVPYFFWNCLVLLMLFLGQRLPLTAALFSGKNAIANDFNFFDLIINFQGVPIAYQFWFIRDLFIICLLTPIIYFAIKKLKYAIIIILIALWFIGVPGISALLFFSIGAMFSILDIDILEKFKGRGNAIFFLYPIIAILDLVTKGHVVNEYIHYTGLLLGIVFVFNLTAHFVAKGRIKENLFLSNASFFVFAMHEPLLTFVKKLGIKLLYPTTDFTLTIIYFAAPLFVISFGLGLYFFICKKMPKLLILLTGRRV